MGNLEMNNFTETAQRVMAPATIPDYPSSVPNTYMREGDNQLLDVSWDLHTCAVRHAYAMPSLT